MTLALAKRLTLRSYDPYSMPRSMDVVRPKDVPRGRILCEKDYQQALHSITATSRRFLQL